MRLHSYLDYLENIAGSSRLGTDRRQRHGGVGPGRKRSRGDGAVWTFCSAALGSSGHLMFPFCAKRRQGADRGRCYPCMRTMFHRRVAAGRSSTLPYFVDFHVPRPTQLHDKGVAFASVRKPEPRPTLSSKLPAGIEASSLDTTDLAQRIQGGPINSW